MHSFCQRCLSRIRRWTNCRITDFAAALGVVRPRMHMGRIQSGHRLKDFERRRSGGVGQFLTAADLAPERSKPLGDAVGRLRGTYVVRSGSTACLTTTRGSQSFQHSATGSCGNREVGGANCPVAVFVDGSPWYTGHNDELFDLNSLRTHDIAGLEFYSGAGTLPREFSAPRGTCGALVIWTKR